MTPRFLAALAATIGLTACEPVPTGGMTIPEGTVDRMATMDMNNIVPSVSTQAALQAFETYCGRYPANPQGTARAALANGYFLLGRMQRQNLEMYVSENGGPLVATGAEDGAEVCMIMVRENAALGPALDRYVQQRSPEAINIGTMQIGADRAEHVSATMSTPPVLYFTMIQTDPTLGRVQALATVTE